uniref:Uncharacterized protein n=1 Tax=Eutreptiella gymnastica TaxID=73025 RepID=A0A7S4LJQ1_9EUGL|mmetsp:Transcript_97203/g.163487  ORF Transcript_97203/g.163487 Transcript_97203/m.163487 type:complete len:137 (+) Transcript_97203:166-576(+)
MGQLPAGKATRVARIQKKTQPLIALHSLNATDNCANFSHCTCVSVCLLIVCIMKDAFGTHAMFTRTKCWKACAVCTHAAHGCAYHQTAAVEARPNQAHPRTGFNLVAEEYHFQERVASLSKPSTLSCDIPSPPTDR